MCPFHGLPCMFLLVSFIVLYVWYICVYVHVCLEHTCVNVHGGQRLMPDVFLSYSSPHFPSRLTSSEGQGCPCLCLPRIIDRCCYFGFMCGDPNSGSHSWMTSTLLANPHPQPLCHLAGSRFSSLSSLLPSPQCCDCSPPPHLAPSVSVAYVNVTVSMDFLEQ